MKKLVVAGGLLLAALLALGAWLFAPHIFMPSVAVSDIRQVETLVLGEATGNPHTYRITVQGSGEIDGEATMSLLHAGEPCKVEKLSGKVSFEWGGDWYSETAEVRYEPANVRSGNVVLHYRFHQ